jgi:hypothetical protein
MPDLSFQVESVAPERDAGAPLLLFRVRITEKSGEPVQSALLRCQIRIEPARRSYTPAEKERLRDLFGTPEHWGQTLRPWLWTHTVVVAPAFAGAAVVDLPVPCSSDFSRAATKYFDALAGDIPLCFLFSGTVFYEAADGGLQVAQIPWDREANFRLSAAAWQELMERYYANSAWLCLRKDVLDRLSRYKSRRGLATWEQALEALLAAAEEAVTP